MDIVAFGKVVAQEFGVTMTPEVCANISTLDELVKCLDAQT